MTEKIYKPEPHESGNIHLLETTIFKDENENEINRKNHRRVLKPNDDVSDLPQYAKDICNRWWQDFSGEPPTPEELAEQEEKRLLQEKRKQVKEELKASKPPQSNPELSKRIEKLEFVLGITEGYTE